MTWTTGRRCAGITLENQLGAQEQIPKGHRRTKLLIKGEARAKFGALRSHEGRCALNDLARTRVRDQTGSRVDLFRDATRVVAMKSLTVVSVDFGRRTRLIGERQLRADNARRDLTGILRS